MGRRWDWVGGDGLAVKKRFLQPDSRVRHRAGGGCLMPMCEEFGHPEGTNMGKFLGRVGRAAGAAWFSGTVGDLCQAGAGLGGSLVNVSSQERAAE